jgi:hypothetical protein
VRLGIASFLTGLGLYVAAAIVRLGPYRGEPQPSWLTSLWLVATALVALGLLVLVNGAVHVYRSRN